MSLAPEASAVSGHVRFPSREGVEEALLRMDVAYGAPVPVWPPRKLPFGVFVSPLRNGWVSLWSPLDDLRDWFPRLTATLECPGTLLEVVESRFWTADFYHDERFAGRVEQPTEAVLYDDLWARTQDSLAAEGRSGTREDEALFGARMDEIAESEEYQEAVRQLEEQRPEKGSLAPFLPPHASLEQAWELLWAMDHVQDEDEAEDEAPYAEDYLDNFASYLGIRDAAWHPSADMEALSEGDYEEEGLPDGWRDFHVLPVRHLPML